MGLACCSVSNTKLKYTEGRTKNEVRKAKARIKLNLARGIKDYKEGFYKCISDKTKARENVGSLQRCGDLVTQDMKKAEVPNTAFTSVLTSKTCLQELQVPETRG